jgi:hypothetical protein
MREGLLELDGLAGMGVQVVDDSPQVRPMVADRGEYAVGDGFFSHGQLSSGFWCILLRHARQTVILDTPHSAAHSSTDFPAAWAAAIAASRAILSGRVVRGWYGGFMAGERAALALAGP